MSSPTDLHLPADVRHALHDASERTGTSPSEIVEQALRTYLRENVTDTLREEARRQSLRAQRADRETARRELDAWEENADTSGWRA